MSDIIRWLAKDVADCEAAIAGHEAQAERYEAEAAKVAFDAEAQSYMMVWAALKRHAADEARQQLTVLKRRLEAA